MSEDAARRAYERGYRDGKAVGKAFERRVHAGRRRYSPHPMFAAIRLVRKSKLPKGLRATALHLATNVTRPSNGQGLEVPVAKLAAQAGLSYNTAVKHLAMIAAAGVITIERRPNHPKGNRYSFVLESSDAGNRTPR